MKFKVFLLYLCCASFPVFSQQDAWVYLNKKENVAISIQNPNSILSQEAIARKKKYNIPIDAQDVPVNEAYIKELKTASGIKVMAKSKWMNAVHVRGELSDIKMLSGLDFVASIDFADKHLVHLSKSGNQTDKFALKASLKDFEYGIAQNQVGMIKVDALHLEGFTGEGLVIAVFDGGFSKVNTMTSFSKLRTNNRLRGGYDFINKTASIFEYTGDSHGTKVLSAMAGYIENEFVGTAPDASYYLFRTEDITSENPVEESYWVEAAERADSLGVHIINSSLGYSDFDNSKYNYAPSDMDGKTTFITRGATIASQKGIMVINSAGNSGNNSWGIVTAPADAEGVLSVGAVDKDGIYAAFSSRGNAFQPSQKPDVVAQGAKTVVIDELDRMVYDSGTSFSAPILAGAIACLWQALPNDSAERIKELVRLSASQYTVPDYFLGYGIPNFQLALSMGLSSTEFNAAQFKIYPNPVSDYLHIISSSNTDEKTLCVYDLLGKRIKEQTYLEANPILDVSELVNGLYMLTIISKNKTVNFKFIKS